MWINKASICSLTQLDLFDNNGLIAKICHYVQYYPPRYRVYIDAALGSHVWKANYVQ